MSGRVASLLLTLLVAAGCGRGRGATPPARPSTASASDSATGSPVAWSGVTPHPRNIQAGAVIRADSGGNPYASQQDAVKIGESLFNRYNCDGCHGDGAAGSVGPSLADGRWRYGGTPREIYQSVYEGRPLGMPSYRAVAHEPIWYLVAYVRSLQDSTDHATANGTTWGAAAR